MLHIQTNDDILKIDPKPAKTSVIEQHLRDKTIIKADVPPGIVHKAFEFGRFYYSKPKKIQNKISNPATYDNPRKINTSIINWFSKFNKSIENIENLVMLISFAELLNMTPLVEICCYIMTIRISGKNINEII